MFICIYSFVCHRYIAPRGRNTLSNQTTHNSTCRRKYMKMCFERICVVCLGYWSHFECNLQNLCISPQLLLSCMFCSTVRLRILSYSFNCFFFISILSSFLRSWRFHLMRVRIHWVNWFNLYLKLYEKIVKTIFRITLSAVYFWGNTHGRGRQSRIRIRDRVEWLELTSWPKWQNISELR